MLSDLKETWELAPHKIATFPSTFGVYPPFSALILLLFVFLSPLSPRQIPREGVKEYEWGKEKQTGFFSVLKCHHIYDPPGHYHDTPTSDCLIVLPRE